MQIRIDHHPARKQDGTQSHAGLICIWLDGEQCGHFWNKAGDEFFYLCRPFEQAVVLAIQNEIISTYGLKRECVMAPGLVKVSDTDVPIIDDDFDEEWGE